MIESLDFRAEKWSFCIYEEESQESLGGDILEIHAFFILMKEGSASDFISRFLVPRNDKIEFLGKCSKTRSSRKKNFFDRSLLIL
jgi:hypothetical protein